MTYASIEELRSQLGSTPKPELSAAYVKKMMHEVPEAESVDRAKFLLQRVAGKRVLEFGASGPMHEAIVKAAAVVIGVDREEAPGVVGFDLDSVYAYKRELPYMESPDVIVCGEVLEHLSNPGWFLDRLFTLYLGVPVIVTVPNAFSKIGHQRMADGIENVNIDHVAWYSYRTLRTLLERHGYTIAEFRWYNGEPGTAEGLIVVMT